VQQNINILRNRVNQLGVAEPLVQRQGADRIVVELPGIQDTARAKDSGCDGDAGIPSGKQQC
jgi:preprotein translocase subunit SecD